MKSFLGLLPLLPALVASKPVHLETIHNDAAPILTSTTADHIPDSYIIVFKDHVGHESAAAHHGWVRDLHASAESSRAELRKRSQLPLYDDVFEGVKHTYNMLGGLMGYSGHFDEDTIEMVRRQPDVAYIERDSIVHTMKDNSSDEKVEKNAPWGLARISHRDHLTFGNFNKYLYSSGGGEGVDVYVIDTGTYVDHVDFEGRAKWLATIPQGDEDKDGNGHGTHCSGTVAGKKYGVAKKAHVRAIKVLRSNGSGTMSDVVAGVEKAVESHLEEVKKAEKGKRKGFKGSTANMSLGGGKSPALDKAVNAAVNAGIHFAVAAGNDNANSCNYSPASAEGAVTVGASTLQDTRAYFSNYGKCNDIFAPGLNIQSTWIGSKYAVNTISGTSMASPHIAGLLAYLLSLQPAKDSAYAVADITPKKLKANLISIATSGALSDVPSDTANILAWNGGGSSNYTDIVSQGGYSVSKDIPITEIEIEFPSVSEIEETLEDEIELLKAKVEMLEQEMEVEGKDLARKVQKTGHKASNKVQEVRGKIEDLVSEELREFFNEM